MGPWVAEAPTTKYGGAFINQNQSADPGAAAMAGVSGPAAGERPLSPSNPLLWVGVLAAVTVGLMSYSTTVRVGPVSASVKAG